MIRVAKKGAAVASVSVALCLAAAACSSSSSSSTPNSTSSSTSSSSSAAVSVSLSQLNRSFSAMSTLKPLASSGKGNVAVLLPDTVSSARYTEFDAPYLTQALTAAGLRDNGARGTGTTDAGTGVRTRRGLGPNAIESLHAVSYDTCSMIFASSSGG